MTSDEMPECPLCMVELFYDDLAFYPCSCGYQICRFCWSKILNEENGLCPACRRAYDSEAPASFTPLSEEQFQKLKREKRQKERKNKTIENRKHLADIRVVQRNLAFVIGLPQRFADHPEILKSPEYFGKYGKVFKVVVNRNAAQPSSQNQSTVGAYVTFVKGEDTIQAILDLNKQQMEGRTLKASLGTTKYCSQFLKGASCTKGECMYLHELGEQAASFTKEEMQQNKHTEYERKLIDDFIEQSGMSTESNVTSSSSQPQQTPNQSASQNQSQSHNRLQHASECRDQSSSSSNSNSNTPPSSRRQTKSESHTQSHRHQQQSHHSKHVSNHRSGATTNPASSSGDVNSSATQSSQRTPRKNSQNYKLHHHNQTQSSHTRGHQQKQKQRSTQHQHQHQQQQQQHQHQHQQQQQQQPQQQPSQQQPQQQQPQQQQPQQQQPQQQQLPPRSQQQTRQADVTAPQQTQNQSSQPPEIQNQNQQQTSTPTQPLPPASAPADTASCTPSGDPVTDIMPQDAPNSTSFPISTGLSLPSALMGFDRQASLHSLPGSGPSLNDDDQSANNTAVSACSGSIPSASISTATETSSALQPTPSLLPNSHQFRPQAQALNGLSGSAVGMQPFPMPMCSYSLQQFMLDYHRQQQQFQQQQSLLNSFDSQSLPTTSFQPERQTSQTEIPPGQSEEQRQYQLPPLPPLSSSHSSSKWPVTDASSLVQETTPATDSLVDTFSPQDDVANLDFDPVKESQQALAALLEHERNNCVSNTVSAPNTGFLSGNCTQSQLTPPPGFEIPPSFTNSVRPSVLRPPNMNMCHPGMMGYGYYSSGVPPGPVDMCMPNEACINRPEKANNVNMGITPGADRPRHLPSANSTTGHSSAPGPPSPGLSFSVKALQDTLRCVLPEETNITFDPSLMQEMQFQQFEQCVTNAPVTPTNSSSASQIPLDAITSANNSRGLDQSLDAMANTSAKETSTSLWPHNGFCLDDDPAVLASAPGATNSLPPEYCSLWPPTPSRNKEKSSAVDNDICLHSDAVWSSPTTPPGFGSTVLHSFIHVGDLGSSNVRGIAIEGQRSAISVDAQTSVTATGDQQQAINKL